MTKEAIYSSFCEKLNIDIINEFKVGESIVVITKYLSMDGVSVFESSCKSKELSNKDRKSALEQEIKKRKSKITWRI